MNFIKRIYKNNSEYYDNYIKNNAWVFIYKTNPINSNLKNT